jgi:hypothetical protein
MSAKGRRYYEGFIETQATTIREQQVKIVEQKGRIVSLENAILAHHCNLKNVIRQFFGYSIKH